MEQNVNKKPNRLVFIGVVAFLGIGLIFVLMSGKKNKTKSEPQPTKIIAATTLKATPTISDIKNITIDAGAFYFNPAEIKVKKGEKVKIVINIKDMMHDFVIDELGVRAPVAVAGKATSVEFVADKQGEFEYYCSVGQHKARGQTGKLIVE